MFKLFAIAYLSGWLAAGRCLITNKVTHWLLLVVLRNLDCCLATGRTPPAPLLVGGWLPRRPRPPGWWRGSASSSAVVACLLAE